VGLQTRVSEFVYKRNNLHSDILPNLDPVICRTIDDINTCLKLRYEEYCLKRNWENATEFPDGLEKDPHDDKAVHILLVDRLLGRPVGTVRVLFHRPGDPIEESLPSFQLSPAFKAHFMDLARTKHIAEVSRFTISRDKITKKQNRQDLARGVFPALALVKGVLKATAFDQVDIVVKTVTPSLKRLLARTGFHYQDIGVRIEHHGARVPVYRSIPALLAELNERNPDIWRYCTDAGDTWPLDRSSL